MLSAHETIRLEQDRVEDLVTLIDQHADVATRADELRAGTIMERALGADVATSLEGQESWGALAASLRHAEDYGHDPIATLQDAYKQRELGTADDVPAVLHWRIEQALEGIGQPTVLLVDREPVDGVPAWIADGRRHQDELLPAEWRDHLAERHHYIGVRLRECGATLALEQPAWTQDLGRLPSEPWRMFDWHRTAAEVDVLRMKYRIDPSEPQAIPDKLRGNPVADRLQERVTTLHKAAALSTAPEVTASTREHYAASAAESSAAARTALLTATESTQQTAVTAVVTASDVVAESAEQTRSETAVKGSPQPSTAEAAPAAPTGTATISVAAASPTTAQEGTTMSDPIDDTLDQIGRHAGRTGQTITSEVARQIQRANDDRRRALLDAQRKVERDQEQATRDAQRKAERDREQVAREAAKEKERTDRLAARYGTLSSNETTGVTTTPAAEGVESAETRAATAASTRAERERRLLEGAGYDPDKRATAEEIKAREERRRIEHRDATQMRGDEGLER